MNGALIAADPSLAAVERLGAIWHSLAESAIFGGSLMSQARTLAKYGTHVHSSAPLRRLIVDRLPVTDIEQLPVRFQCVAASIEEAAAHWFESGSIADAVLASCAVPGLLAPAVIDGEHFLDGGLVHSIPVGRALALGARRIFVIHVGRVEQPLRAPRGPWQVGLVAFEIARRHRFVEEMASIPDGTEVHLLPSGMDDTPTMNLRYRDASRVGPRIARAHRASVEYLAELDKR